MHCQRGKCEVAGRCGCICTGHGQSVIVNDGKITQTCVCPICGTVCKCEQADKWKDGIYGYLETVEGSVESRSSGTHCAWLRAGFSTEKLWRVQKKLKQTEEMLEIVVTGVQRFKDAPVSLPSSVTTLIQEAAKSIPGGDERLRGFVKRVKAKLGK